jgi:magnesium-transporting ATPase (P-type)
MSEAVPSAAFLVTRGGIPLPLTVMQILSIDLGTDMMPALGLGTELPEAGIMDRPPRSMKERLLNKRTVLLAFFWYGLLESIIAMGAYFLVNIENGWPGVPLAASGAVYAKATAMTLAAIVFCQIGVVLCCRTEKQSVFKIGLFSNKRVLLGIIIEILLISAILYVPVLQNVFHTAPIGLREWLYLLAAPIPILVIDEARKAFSRMRAKKKGTEV